MAAEATGALSIPERPDCQVLVTRAVRRCSASRSDGQPCGATPLRDAPVCFVHDLSNSEKAMEARRLG